MKIKGIEGATFGLMDGIVTTLGIIIGLGATGSRLALIVGVLVTTVADALADAAGIHVSQETERKHSNEQVRFATIFSFAFRLLAGIILIIPIFLLEFFTSVFVSVAVGMVMIAFLGYFIGKTRKESTLRMIAEYIGLGLVVVVISYYIGILALGLV